MALPFSAQVSATAQAVNPLPGSLKWWHIVNTTAAIAYMQVFNKKIGDVTVGTTTPDYVIPIPASGGGVAILLGRDIPHSIACTIACTTGRSNNTGAACDVLIGYE